MTKHVKVKSLNAPVSRRQVMIGIAGLSFAVAFGGKAARPPRWQPSAPARR